jgi:hypothetical protein
MRKQMEACLHLDRTKAMQTFTYIDNVGLQHTKAIIFFPALPAVREVAKKTKKAILSLTCTGKDVLSAHHASICAGSSTG